MDVEIVGGSDWRELLRGCARRLALDKLSARDGDGERASGVLRRGARLESVAIDEYVEHTGHEIIARQLEVISDEYPWARGHIDAIWRDRDGREGVLEVKTVNPWRWSLVRDGVPDEWRAQVQWYMWLSQRDVAHVWVLEPVEWRTVLHVVGRDDALIRELIDTAREYVRVVSDGDLPPVLDVSDERCRGCRYRIECHWRDGVEDDAGDVERDDSLISLVAAYVDAQRVLREAEGVVSEARERLRRAMRDRRRVMCGTWCVERRTVRRSPYMVRESVYEVVYVRDASGRG